MNVLFAKEILMKTEGYKSNLPAHLYADGESKPLYILARQAGLTNDRKSLAYRLYDNGLVIFEELFEEYDNSQPYCGDYKLVVIPEEVGFLFRVFQKR